MKMDHAWWIMDNARWIMDDPWSIMDDAWSIMDDPWSIIDDRWLIDDWATPKAQELPQGKKRKPEKNNMPEKDKDKAGREKKQ